MTTSTRSVPPAVLNVSQARLRRHRVEDAAGIAAAVTVSLPELRRWMPWATEEAAEANFQRARLEGIVGLWEKGTAFSYVIVEGNEVVIGAMSLMRRIDPGGLEIGYWLRSDRTGRGIATECVEALTSAALQLPGITRVEIHCDQANGPSAAIPERLGYRLDRVEDKEITAPGEIGRSMIWLYPAKTPAASAET